MLKFSVKTEFNTDTIMQSLINPGESCVFDSYRREVIRLRDEGVIMALKSLGWSTPDETRKLIERIHRLEFKLKCLA